MTDTFGDATPEDAWDPDDPLDDLIDNLDRRLTLLGEPALYGGGLDHGALVDALEERLAVVRRTRNLDRFDEQRARMIADDIAHIRRRLREG